MSFCIAFTSQPVRTNSVASQSSRSGCDGASPCDPKSSVVFTIPVLKYICQKRFTVTRASSGFDGSTSHSANPNQFGGYAAGDDSNAAGSIGVTASPTHRLSRVSTNVEQRECIGLDRGYSEGVDFSSAEAHHDRSRRL